MAEPEVGIDALEGEQALNENGPGTRPVEDYTTNDNADRRAQYLAVASDTRLGHLRDMVDARAPGGGNYRAEFLAKPADDALVDIITGAGALSKGELAGRLADETRVAVSMAHNIPDPFDRHLTDTASGSAFGRSQALNVIEALEKQADTIAEGAAAFGFTINTSPNRATGTAGSLCPT